ncbi:MAG: archaeosortase/exosortase family protein [Candidatus Bathyarchaeota archaeon]|nr:archaeosortase/exosortase family protein [Candidatus Bathyarchaeota archaeon]
MKNSFQQSRATALKLLPIIAFIVPLALLFLLNPYDPYLKLSGQDSFNFMWKGRTFLLFFVWLIALEFILSWEKIVPKISRQNKTRLVALTVALLLPTLYVVLANYFGLNGAIANWAQTSGVAFYDSMPLAIEYLVFSGLFCLTTLLLYGKKGLMAFILPAIFVALVGILYTIDNVFPYGEFTPFQLLVPTTAMLASNLLGLMGYTAVLGTEVGTGMPTIQATGPLGTAKFAIAWPCAGIESLLIFTAVTLLFLKRIPMSWRARIGYFSMGIIVTYFINVLRIATIFTIGMEFGTNSNQVQMFHFYYGPLYAMAWIISYPLLIIASQKLYRKFNGKKQAAPTVPLGNVNQNG